MRHDIRPDAVVVAAGCEGIGMPVADNGGQTGGTIATHKQNSVSNNVMKVEIEDIHASLYTRDINRRYDIIFY